MAVTISGSTGIQTPDGTVSVPPYAGADTNTGVYFPATDQMAVTVNGVQKLLFNTAGMVATGAASSTIYAVGSTSGTITLDLNNGGNQSFTLTGNSTLANPSNLAAGMTGVLFITQDGTGSRTLAYGTYWDWPNSGTPALTTTANAVDVIVWTARSTTSIVAQIIPNIG